ncbi:hypothetical protein O6H91_20G045700 [Diphasiastrum complanatum]|uniref:Uncharacterized protein n=1 Tax=Diphasiastrum complanatum TaxID=34168 RepID=A0ACC2AQ67_DIPCM|nr:hypothetical protein O6H91_20G045700 [Diphasiastrum complanatum]
MQSDTLLSSVNRIDGFFADFEYEIYKDILLLHVQPLILIPYRLYAGAHTLGVGHCVSIINRLYPTRDNTLGFGFGGQLRLTCPTPYPAFINNNTFMQNDLTNVFFDNQYFRDLMVGRGLFSIDSEVANDPTTSQIVSAFAQNQNLFFSNFASAFVKLTASNVLTGDQGEVRRNCAFVN